MASQLCLVLGGVRSGKSAFAEKLARELDGPTMYVATGLRTDLEMEERIHRHRESRPDHWTTVEEPLDLTGRLEKAMASAEPPQVILIDSIDLWVANILVERQHQSSESVECNLLSGVDRLLRLISLTPASFLLVSSEVGLGLVPLEALGRRFQDLLGLVNQRVAAAAGRAYLVVAGMPMLIKGVDGARDR